MKLKDRILNIFQKKALRFYPAPIQIINGQIISPADNKEAYLNDGYLVNDVIYSIVSLIADKVRLANWGQYEIVDESSLKQYHSLLRRKDLSYSDFIEADKLKKKAMQLTEGDQRLAKILEWANEDETFSDFVTSGSIYKMITGDRFVAAEKVEMGANEGKPFYLYNIPSQLVSIIASNTFPAKALGYKLFSYNKEYTTEEILHEKYFNPSYKNNGQQLYGMSPLKAALKRYTRNNSAMTAATAAFDNQGMKGMVFPDIDPELVSESNVQQLLEQSSKIKQKLTGNEYAGASNYGKVAGAAYRMGYIPIGLSPVDMNIIESEKWDAVMICNVFGVPPELLGLTNKTYNNVKEAEKSLTTRSCFPLLSSFRDYFNMKLKKDWGYKNEKIIVDYDVSVYTELNDGVGEIVTAMTPLFDRGAINGNELREKAGLKRTENQMHEQYFMTGNYLPEDGESEIDKELDK